MLGLPTPGLSRRRLTVPFAISRVASWPLNSVMRTCLGWRIGGCCGPAMSGPRGCFLRLEMILDVTLMPHPTDKSQLRHCGARNRKVNRAAHKHPQTRLDETWGVTVNLWSGCCW